MNQNVQDLARLSLRKKPFEVHIDENKTTATVEGLEQGYVVVESDLRFLLLFTFLKKNRNKKIIVFFSSCNSVKFNAELLNYIDLPVMDLHVSIFKPEIIVRYEYYFASHLRILMFGVKATILILYIE